MNFGQYRPRDKSPILNKPSLVANEPILRAKDVWGTIQDNANEIGVLTFTNPSDISAVMMNIRIRASIIYSCTGTPTLTFRLRVGDGTVSLAQDKGAEIQTTCRNNASGEVMQVVLEAVKEGAVISGGASFAVVSSPGVSATVWGGTSVFDTAISTATIKRIQMSVQWSAQNPANSATIRAGVLEVLYPGLTGV